MPQPTEDWWKPAAFKFMGPSTKNMLPHTLKRSQFRSTRNNSTKSSVLPWGPSEERSLTAQISPPWSWGNTTGRFFTFYIANTQSLQLPVSSYTLSKLWFLSQRGVYLPFSSLSERNSLWVNRKQAQSLTYASGVKKYKALLSWEGKNLLSWRG